VEFISHMLNQIGLKVKNINSEIKYTSIHLKNDCEISRCLICEKWNNNKSDNVIVLIIVIVSLIVDDHIVQGNTNTHD
jgi:hypothetical protein